MVSQPALACCWHCCALSRCRQRSILLRRCVPVPQTRDAVMWWYPLCRWGAEFCSSHKWGWACGLTLQYCQVRAAIGCWLQLYRHAS